MDYKASGGPLSALFPSQMSAELWARKRAESLGRPFKIERGKAVSFNGKTGWWQDLTFEPIWIFEDEPKVAPV